MGSAYCRGGPLAFDGRPLSWVLNEMVDKERAGCLLFNLMVEHAVAETTEQHLDEVFAALADPTRRAIVHRLASGEATVTELATPFPMSLQAVSKHVQVLERAGLIARTRRAQQRPCRLRPEALAPAGSWLGDYRQLWEHSFDRLDHVVTNQEGSAP